MYLAGYVDNTVTPDPEWTFEAEREKHLERLAREAAVAMHARDVPRRLGSEANAKELAADTKYAKKVAFGAMDMMKAWGSSATDIEKRVQHYSKLQDVKSEGAQMDWEDHLALKIAHIRQSIAQMASSATHAIRVKEGNKCLLRLENELNLAYDRYERVFGLPEKIQLDRTPRTNTDK